MTTTEQDRPDLPPDDDQYLPEPSYDEPQDDGGPLGPALVSTNPLGLMAARVSGSPAAPRDWRETLDWAFAQTRHRSKDWTGRCQEFSRTASGCPGGAATAFIQWTLLPDDAKHPTNDWRDAPVGARHFSIGSNPAGHVWIEARPFADGTPGSISTDALRQGWPDRVASDFPMRVWGQDYLGWGEWHNGFWLDVKDPKPIQDKPYAALNVAIERLGNALDDLRHARDEAKEQEDWKDRDKIQARIDALRAQKRQLIELYNTLRRF